MEIIKILFAVAHTGLYIILPLIILATPLQAQSDSLCSNYGASSALMPLLADKEIVVIGEMHFNPNFNSKLQLSIINEGLKRHSKLYLYLEIPPSAVHIIDKYLITGDSSYLSYPEIKGNFNDLLNHLQKQGYAHLTRIIPLDAEYRNKFGITRTFLSDLASAYPSLKNHHLTGPIVRSTSARNLRRSLSTFGPQIDKKLLEEQNLDPRDIELFLILIQGINTLGLRNGGRIGIHFNSRTIQFARVISSFQYTTDTFHLVVIGRNHVFGDRKKGHLSLKSALRQVNGPAIFSLTPIYPNNPWIFYENAFYQEETDFCKLLSLEIVDFIISNQD